VYPLEQEHIAELKARDGTGPPVTSIIHSTTTSVVTSSTTSTRVSTTTTTATTSTVVPTGFVRTSGQKFVLNGSTFTPAGSNAYYLAQWGNADIDQTFTELAAIGVTTVRTWGFNDVTADPGYGAYYQLWTNGVATLNTGANGLQRFDYVITSAKAHGIKLIVPLTNNWSDYGGMDVYISQLNPGGTHDTFYTNAAVIAAYKNYIAGFVGRYANEPTILAWELANEPRCGGSSGSVSRFLKRTPPPHFMLTLFPQPSSSCKAPTITNWASQISAYIKSIDSNHLVAIGGACFLLCTRYELMSLPFPLDEGLFASAFEHCSIAQLVFRLL
jgi:mannan endo-1,4-beta-mannosidase